MTATTYTVGLAKGQGMPSETIQLLKAWQEGMSAVELKRHVIAEGLLPKATNYRASDLVSRVFAPRYLANGATAAKNLKQLLALDFPADRLLQLFLIYTPRANLILNLDGLAKNIKLLGNGKAWLVATAQQMLTEDDPRAQMNTGKLFKLKDRFPIPVELEASDIREICYRRLLTKSSAGERKLAGLFDTHGQALRNHTQLGGTRFFKSDLEKKGVLHDKLKQKRNAPADQGRQRQCLFPPDNRIDSNRPLTKPKSSMGFDPQTRNKLQRMVGACRRLLTDEFDDQLQGLYGIYAPDGRVLDLEKLTSLDDDHHQTATLLRDRINHLTSGLASEKQPLAEAVRRVLREQAFTLLNRFAALRMAEERGFVRECVGQGLKSKGFQVFETVARSGLGGAYERYVTFIQGMFDELSLDLGVLFDRWSPFGLLFPREPALLKFLELLNDPELKPLWKEDETIGWIYQYFNDEAERKKMREDSAAPRNSRELAVRNQFFTPRYVVEFLTDNTLGRIWYEMTRGEIELKEQCRYLVRRPVEIFLKPGEQPPPPNSPGAASVSPSPPSEGGEGRGEVGASSTATTQEDLLKQPVFIPHRPLKDPREIRLLHPACGSMHFGLYAFDLFEVIYEEYRDLTAKNTARRSPNQSRESVTRLNG